MIKDNNKNKQHEYNPMTELELTKLAEKIVAKMMRLKTVEDWFKHMAKTKVDFLFGDYLLTNQNKY